LPSLFTRRESDPLPKLRRGAGVFHDEPFPLHVGRDACELVDHEAADALAAQVRCNEKIVDADAIVCELRRNDGNDVADELSEETVRGDGAGVAVRRKKRADLLVVLAVDGADEESLSSHDTKRPAVRNRHSVMRLPHTAVRK
jgi:hypothetical protein